jgi:hypothetical protein
MVLMIVGFWERQFEAGRTEISAKYSLDSGGPYWVDRSSLQTVIRIDIAGLIRCQSTRSMTMAMPCPPPIHNVINAYFPPIRFSS